VADVLSPPGADPGEAMAQTTAQAGTPSRRPTVSVEPIRPAPKRQLPWPVRFYRSSVGKKWVMGVTGIVLMSFVLVHMIGNLKLYLSKEEINLYGEALRDMPGHLLPRTWLLWGIRTGLIASFVFHIHSAYGLTVINRRARPDRYQSKRDYVAANFASRTMRWTGIIVLLYQLFHLADLTWGAANPDFVRGDPYNNLVYSLQRPVIAGIYIVANIALGIHLFHGAWSMFQSLGLNNPKYNMAKRRFAQGFALVILVGNVSFPVAVQLHLVETQCPHTPPTEPCKSAAAPAQLNAVK
jgi:succinate dehydrogenase / fumarate reductase cytochrome b subunit